jgi:hypothetical protein
MRIVRKLGLAVLATLALATAVAPGSASATTLCSVNMATCPLPARYPAMTAVGAEVIEEPAVIAIEVEEEPVAIECEAAEAKTYTAAESGAPLMGFFGMYLFESCFAPGFGLCTVAEVGQAYSAAYEATGGGNGSLVVEELTEGPPTLEVQCGMLTCFYAAESVELQVMGGAPAVWVLNEAPLTVQMGSGEACGENATWSAEYTTFIPESVFVAAAP